MEISKNKYNVIDLVSQMSISLFEGVKSDNMKQSESLQSCSPRTSEAEQHVDGNPSGSSVGKSKTVVRTSTEPNHKNTEMKTMRTLCCYSLVMCLLLNLKFENKIQKIKNKNVHFSLVVCDERTQ